MAKKKKKQKKAGSITKWVLLGLGIWLLATGAQKSNIAPFESVEPTRQPAVRSRIKVKSA